MAFNRKQRLQDNIEAIRTVFTLEREQRAATTEERAILQKYCGFGGLKCILNPARELTDAVHWAKSDLDLFAPTVELHKLIRENSRDDMEYKRYLDSLKQSVLTAFYTPPEITATIAGVLHEYGICPDHVLEPSAGAGAFVDAVLENNPDADVMAFEKDLMTGRILKHLHPDRKVRIQGFEKIEAPFMDYFDLAISNIPFGDIAVFDPVFQNSRSFGRRSSQQAIHNYFFLKGVDAVRDGGIVAFITSQGVLNSTKVSVRKELFRQADLVSAIRLPNNLFTDNAGTEVGSDLIVLQKNRGKTELTPDEHLMTMIQTDVGTNLTDNAYFKRHSEHIVHTTAKVGTDPYGKPAMVYLHEGKVAGIAEDLHRMLDEDCHARLSMRLYSGAVRQAEERPAVEAEMERPGVEPETLSPARASDIQAVKPQPAEEKPEAETHRPEYPEGVQLSLFDLWGMSEEIRKQDTSTPKKKTVINGSAVKCVVTKPKTQVIAVPPIETIKPVAESKETKPVNEMRQDNSEDVYATLDWDGNPPVNGFYETMMTLSPEQRTELRQRTAGHREEQHEEPDVKTVPGMSEEEIQHAEVRPETVSIPFTDNSRRVATTLFPEYESTPKQGEAPDLSPRPYNQTIEPHHREGSMVMDAERNLGYLKNLTPYGATFQPLDLQGYQKEKALLYVSLRDAYERLYRHEAEKREENTQQRGILNTHYDEFVMRYGNLNARQNVKLVMMDAGGRDILSLERVEEGKFVKADIFEHPVSFSMESEVIAGSPEEALSASLNRFGTVDLDYMRTITDTTEEELLAALQGRIFYNPLAGGYEIKDRFIAGNVIEKAERIEGWLNDNSESERQPEVKQALEALKEAEPQRITFEELDFNFGERWIPTGIYSAYMSRLYETDVKIAYSASLDEFLVSCAYKNLKIWNEFCVKGYYRNYDGMSLLKHALHNTYPDMMKSIGKDEDGNDIKVRDSEGIQLANAKIDEIRNGFAEWLEEQSPQFKERLTTMYNRKFNCFVRPKYDGSHQTFPDLNLKGLASRGIKDVYPSQKDCVWMLKQNGGGICDYEVLRP